MRIQSSSSLNTSRSIFQLQIWKNEVMRTKKNLKISFTDFWSKFNERDNHFYNLLNRYFEIELSPNPDYLFFSAYGDAHLYFDDCVKILFTGENLFPDFNTCDYALGFHHLEFEDRYLRYPLYIIYPGYYKIEKKHLEDENLLINRKFCNFVYSNSTNADPFREKFFKELSKYKKVDSGGRFMNNIGGPVRNKIEFIRDYKFTIAFENSCVNGYTTEKIMEPMTVNSMPIYYGNPLIERDFNVNSFVNVNDYITITEAIEAIIYLDRNPDAYIKKLKEPWITEDHLSPQQWEEKLYAFLKNIFDQPFEQAKRRADYGFNLYHTHRSKMKSELLRTREKRNLIKAKIKKIFSFYQSK